MKLTKETDIFVIQVTEKLGRYGYYYDVLMVDRQCNVLRTYVDDANNNVGHWNEIVNNPGQGFVIRNARLKRNWRKLNSEYPVVNADSDIQIQMSTDIDELRNFVLNDLIPDALPSPKHDLFNVMVRRDTL